MDILINGALPPPLAAQKILKLLAPNCALLQLLSMHTAEIRTHDVDVTACTALESYLLAQHQFTPLPEQRLGSGLPALKYRASQGQICHILALCHLQIDPQYTGLIPGSELSITTEQSLALFATCEALFEQRQIKLLDITADYWIISLPGNLKVDCPSTDLLAYLPLHNHWPDIDDLRPLRSLLNEIQMLWHGHEVNLQRQNQGLKAINSAWIYGAAASNQLQDKPQTPYHIIHTLNQAYRTQDWGLWLRLLDEMEAERQSLLKNNNGQDINYVLFGFDRAVRLTPFNQWRRLLNLKTNTWKQWWTQS